MITTRQPGSYAVLPPPTRADYLRRLGWTPELARERMASCRAHQKQYRAEGHHASYRQINAALYLTYKNNLAHLLA